MFARHSLTVTPPILYFSKLRVVQCAFILPRQLEISRIQVIGGEFSFL